MHTKPKPECLHTAGPACEEAAVLSQGDPTFPCVEYEHIPLLIKLYSAFCVPVLFQVFFLK